MLARRSTVALRVALACCAASAPAQLPAYGAPITIRQLIHHTSGLRDQWNRLGYAGWRDDDLISERDVLGIVARQ